MTSCPSNPDVHFVSRCEECPIGLERRQAEERRTTQGIAVLGVLLGIAALFLVFALSRKGELELLRLCGEPL
jgi:hypothetical protein